MPTDDELKRVEDSAEELARGYSDLLEQLEKLARMASGMGADARMLALRAKALRADLTPTRSPSAATLAASRSDSRTGLTAAGGIRVEPYKPTKG